MRGVPGGVRRPARPALPRPAERLPGVRPAGRADRAAPCRRRRRGRRRPPRCCATARSSRSRASAATTSRAVPTTPARWRALRSRKHREDKPFALMVADVAAARGARRARRAGGRAAALAGAADRARPAAPGRARGARRSRPASRELGVMLPYSPLHHLLVRDAGCALVMTSGNVSDEPIAYRDDDAPRAARARSPTPSSSTTARSTSRTDDSVARVVRGRPMVLRRSRGLRPGRRVAARRRARARCSRAAPSSRARSAWREGARAWVGHHIGDLGNAETLTSFREGIAHFERLFAVAPEVVAHDLHPDYLSTSYALEREGVELVGVQHHHAHLAACLAEHGIPAARSARSSTARATATDGTAWGGEILVGDLRGVRARRAPAGRCGCRAATARRASRGGWRARGSSRAGAGRTSRAALRGPRRAGALGRGRADGAQRVRGAADDEHGPAVRRRRGAVRACAPFARYEGQAAIELEALADPAEHGAYASPSAPSCSTPRPALARAARRRSPPARRRAASSPRASTARVARATAAACAAAASRAGARRVVLSGGVFQNRLLLARDRRAARGARAARARPGAPAGQRRRDRLRPGGGRGGGRLMFGLDERLAGRSAAAASSSRSRSRVLLGLRHATDPDHLTALSTLVLSDDERGARRAGRLGLAWGAGHAVTLVALGLPVVLVRRRAARAGRSAPPRALVGHRDRRARACGCCCAGAAATSTRTRTSTARCRHAHPHVHEEAAPRPRTSTAHAEALGALAARGVRHRPAARRGRLAPRVGILLVGALPDATPRPRPRSALRGRHRRSRWRSSRSRGARLLVSGVVARRLVALTPVFGASGLLYGAFYGLSAFT